MTLEALENLARKNGTATTMIDGVEFEVSRQIKSKRRRFNYRYGERHMARDEAERLFPPVYLRWLNTPAGWIGTTTTGTQYTVRSGMRDGRRIVYLDRPTYGIEVCKTIRHAKEYANELARLAGFKPWNKPFEYDPDAMFPFARNRHQTTT